jgi:hypothetical protein
VRRARDGRAQAVLMAPGPVSEVFGTAMWEVFCAAVTRYHQPAVTEIVRRPLAEQLEELGAQLAWVREYL